MCSSRGETQTCVFRRGDANSVETRTTPVPRRCSISRCRCQGGAPSPSSSSQAERGRQGGAPSPSSSSQARCGRQGGAPSPSSSSQAGRGRQGGAPSQVGRPPILPPRRQRGTAPGAVGRARLRWIRSLDPWRGARSRVRRGFAALACNRQGEVGSEARWIRSERSHAEKRPWPGATRAARMHSEELGENLCIGCWRSTVLGR